MPRFKARHSLPFVGKSRLTPVKARFTVKSVGKTLFS